MATHKARVVGAFEVGGVKPGRTVVLDDAEVNVEALVAARLVELIPDKKREKKEGDN